MKKDELSRDTTPRSATPRTVSSTEIVAEAAVMLHTQNVAAEQHAIYLQERAHTQQSIVRRRP